jgi:hypothetical protein
MLWDTFLLDKPGKASGSQIVPGQSAKLEFAVDGSYLTLFTTAPSVGRNVIIDIQSPAPLCRHAEQKSSPTQPRNSKIHQPTRQLRAIASSPRISLLHSRFLVRPELLSDRFPNV